MNKMLVALTIAGMTMLGAGSAFAHDVGGESMGDKFRAVEKESHMKQFPEGHPATKNPLNRCFYSEKDSLFFCQYPLKVAN